MAEPLFLLYPGDPDTVTGGYRYDRRMAEACRTAGWTIEERSLPAGFPFPSDAEREHAAQQVAALPDQAVVVVDGLGFGAMPEIAEAEAERLRLIALVHHPLCDEAGLDPARKEALYYAERTALAAARGVICTSRATARRLRDFAVPLANIHVVEPGTDPRPLAEGRRDGVIRLLAVASFTERKGHRTLLEAVALLDRPSAPGGVPWFLDCAGATGFDPTLEQRLWQQAAALADRVVLHGQVSDAELDCLYREANVFVSASSYEGYGMALAEAIAYGLPVVAATGGAVTETVPESAGLFVAPGDAGALAAGLRQVIVDEALRHRLRLAARAARAQLSDWPTAAARFRTALTALAGIPRP